VLKAGDYMALKDNLKRIRLNAGYKQAKDFAKAAGIPYSSYAVYERGSWPNEANLTRIASTLHVSMDELLGYSANQQDGWEKCVMYLKSMGITDIKIVDDSDDIAISIPNSFCDDLDDINMFFPDNPIVDDRINVATIYTSKKALINIVKKVDKHFIKESAPQYQRLFYWYLAATYNIEPHIQEERYKMTMAELLLRRSTAKETDKKRIDDIINWLEPRIKDVEKKIKENAVKNIRFELVKNDDTTTQE
jgi:transcriptional regulator with XRE-family HTH domain